MKLLFDQNLSSALVVRISELFPGSAHVKSLDLAEADDVTIWGYAARNGFTIVSKDSDFQQRALLLGAPPKVIWLRVGNGPTLQVERVLRGHSIELCEFEMDPAQSLLVLL